MIAPRTQTRNVLGTPLLTCSTNPMTGFFRNGCCDTGPSDAGSHTVCAVMTAEFLAFSKSAGNDLSTPRPEFRFPGLKPGDRWCLCAARWREAFEAGCAPRVVLQATHEAALDIVDRSALEANAVDDSETTTRLTRHRGLDGRIQGEHIRLIRDVIDETDNVADLLGTLSKSFDAL